MKQKAPVLAVILLSYFLILLDNSVMFTGLPSIQRDLALTATQLTWAQDAYTLVFGGLLLLGARLGDVLGRRRVFIVGLLIFVLASAFVGFSVNPGMLIAGRAAQGIGAAIVAPSSLSLLMASFADGPERGRAVAAYGATAGIGASLGLVISGAATAWFSWRSGFFLNLPIGLAMAALAPRYLPADTPHHGRFDLLGSLLATVGVGAAIFGILEIPAKGMVVLPLLLATLLIAGLVVCEARVAQPILPLTLFQDPTRSFAYLTRFLYLGGMIGFFFFTTQLLQGHFGFSALGAGFAFLPMTAVNFAVALQAPRLVNRFSDSTILIVGVIVTLLGMGSLAMVYDSYLIGVALPMVLLGIGQGLAFAPMTSLGIVRVPAAQAGAASGAVNTFHQLGIALGLAVLVAVSAGQSDLVSRVHLALLVAAGFIGAALVSCLFALRTR